MNPLTKGYRLIRAISAAEGIRSRYGNASNPRPRCAVVIPSERKGMVRVVMGNSCFRWMARSGREDCQTPAPHTLERNALHRSGVERFELLEACFAFLQRRS